MTYAGAEDYINGIQKFATKNTLANTREYLRLLGDPQEGIRIVHVAGTNGKGSVCNYLRGLLLAAGYRVGMFTSPHLITMRERIVLDDGMISEQDFTACFDRVRAAADQSGLPHPTFFEFLFLLAMAYYGKEKPDYLILETGLGGRLDATNVFPDPVMTVITQIGLDHVQYLGHTKAQIAAEKAGIIKENVPLVYAGREAETTAVLTEKAEKMGAKAYDVNKNTVLNVNISKKGIDFSYNSLYYNYIDISLSTCAVYQTENAALALRAFELLVGRLQAEPAFLKAAMAKITWAGRMERAAERIFLDGAHNADGVQAFLESVPNIPLRGKRILLFSVVDDKDYDEMVRRLIRSELFTVYIVTAIRSDRGLSEADMRGLFQECGACASQVLAYRDAEQALSAAMSRMGQDDILFCAGSLYLIGELKPLLEKLG